MKKAVIIFLLAFTFFSLIAEMPVITEDFLISNRWGPEKSKFGYRLTFEENGTFEIFFFGMGDREYVSGNYKIVGNDLILDKTDEFNLGLIPKELIGERTRWNLQRDNDSYLYLYKIVSDTGYSFWNNSSFVPDGDVRKIDGIEIIISRIDNCGLKYDIKVRMGPGTDYESSNFYFEANELALPYLPKNRKVNVFGRTLNKEKISNWNDYWYYCELKIGLHDQGPRHGWIYGALLDK